ncbi:MAG TPA: dihydrofolate reductase family protein [Longimicrobiales bacterium]|nr:dihydrofolate reductase family protein [Longimicrobiales bacterium]
MRRLRYSVAMSLDGFIADVDGGYDWIVQDPQIDFGAMFAKVDALIMGRRTYEIVGGQKAPYIDDKAIYVVSTTLDPAEHPDVEIVSKEVERFVAELKAKKGKDIWLFGGGVLFRSLLEAGLVDQVEVGVIPVLLGQGVPLLPGLNGIAELSLVRIEEYASSGIVMLEYDVVSPLAT